MNASAHITTRQATGMDDTRRSRQGFRVFGLTLRFPTGEQWPGLRRPGTAAHVLCGLIVVLWRAGLRVQEALALAEHDLDQRRGSILVRSGKGGCRREVDMDDWSWEQLRPWLAARTELPVGPLFCVIDGATRGRAWSAAAVRTEFRRVAGRAAVRRRFAPHQLRHAHAPRTDDVRQRRTQALI